MMDMHSEAFRQEAFDLLGELETALLELESNSDDAELVGRVFRAMHTIKGSGAMFGFDEIARFTHDIETVYDQVRNGKLSVAKELIDLTLAACDQIHDMVEDPESGISAGADRRMELTRSFKQYLQGGGASDSVDRKRSDSKNQVLCGSETTDRTMTYRIQFRPCPGIFSFGTNPLLLLNELREMGDCRVVAHTSAIPVLDEIDPESCYTSWDVMLTTDRSMNAVRDVFIFVEDDCQLTIRTVDEIGEDDPDYKKLGEILVDRGDLKAEELQAILGRRKRVGELLVQEGAVGPDKIMSALAEQEHVREVRKKHQKTDSSVRVPAEKLDNLVNMVGELVTVQSRLSQIASVLNQTEILQVAEEVERLTSELRDNTMSIRMLPIGTTFSKFKRLVRDLSGELGKEVELTTDGAETELDKTVIERLNDPLVHLIRNSVDHGIESPEERIAAGKSRQGHLHLSAVHSGASVLIEIRDDGAGIDAERVREKAIEKGLIAPDAALPESELFALILMPGFSTAKRITGVSGRGVGMDVVKKSIDSLQGSIEIKSAKGVGTAISLKLPLTLAIIDGLLVRIAKSHFIVPLSAIEECVELTREDVEKSHGQRLARIREELVPYIRLRERFEIAGKRPAIEQIVTTQVDGYRVGLVVDQVIGEHQTVIKALGRFYKDVDEVSGATILGDGKIALILDIPQLVRKVETEERNRSI